MRHRAPPDDTADVPRGTMVEMVRRRDALRRGRGGQTCLREVLRAEAAALDKRLFVSCGPAGAACRVDRVTATT